LVTSLNEAWQAQKQQRQHNVQELLTGFQVERKQIAMQLRDHLRICQDEIRQETRILLTDATQQRQDVTLELTERLSSFRTQLQDQTAQFLAVTAAERSLMAEQLTGDLGEFRQQLVESVALLRHDLQITIAAIASDVQSMRSNTQAELTALRQDRLSNLVTLVDGLRADTQDYLTELATSRQDRAVQIHEQLQANRAHRQAKTQTLRLNLRQHRASLRQNVWGISAEQLSSHPAMPATPLASTLKDDMPSAAESIIPRPFKPAVDLGITTLSLHSTPPPSAEAKSGEPIANLQPLQRDAAQVEADIHTYIRQIEGARLTEIETALGMNRFQTVDALRSLIKKGVVAQRDRIYLAQDKPH
jgi:hypothetical protein